jgi:hypothetical protein
VPGQRQEDLVQARLAEGELRDPDAGPRQLRHPERRALRVGAGGRHGSRIGLQGDGADGSLEELRGLGSALGVQQTDVQCPCADRRLELTGRALGDDAAAVDDGDPVGELVGLLQVLRAEQDRGPPGDQGPGDLPDLPARPRVQAGGRLVEEHHLRGDDDARRDVQPPPHAARVVLGQPARGLADAERVEQLVGPRLRRRPRQPEQAPEQDQVLPAGEVLVDRGQLTGQAHGAAHRVGVGHDVVPEHPRTAGLGLDQGGQHADHRRLAGPVRPQDAVDGALGHGQVDAVDGTRGAERLDEAGRLDREWCLHRHRTPAPASHVLPWNQVRRWSDAMCSGK